MAEQIPPVPPTTAAEKSSPDQQKFFYFSPPVRVSIASEGNKPVEGFLQKIPVSLAANFTQHKAVQGQVVAVSDHGEMRILTSAGEVSLSTKQTLEVGTRITLTLAFQAEKQAASSTIGEKPVPPSPSLPLGDAKSASVQGNAELAVSIRSKGTDHQIFHGIVIKNATHATKGGNTLAFPPTSSQGTATQTPAISSSVGAQNASYSGSPTYMAGARVAFRLVDIILPGQSVPSGTAAMQQSSGKNPGGAVTPDKAAIKSAKTATNAATGKSQESTAAATLARHGAKASANSPGIQQTEASRLHGASPLVPLGTSGPSGGAFGNVLPPLKALVISHGSNGLFRISVNQQTIALTAASPSFLTANTARPPIGSLLMLDPYPLSESAHQGGIKASLEELDILARQQQVLSLSQAPANTLLQQLIPRINSPSLGMAMIFLSAAISSGSLDKWLGNESRALLNSGVNQKKLYQRLNDLIKTGKSRGHDQRGHEWRVYHLPLLGGDHPENIHLYLSGAQEEEEYRKNKKRRQEKRFIIETTFTHTGLLQIDGLYTHEKLSLVIRSEHPFSTKNRQEIRALFNDKMSALNLDGHIDIMVARKFALHLRTNHDRPDSEGIIT